MPSIVSTWNLDGYVDEQRYYCSETPFNINTLPPPKATLAGNIRTYTDTSVTVNTKYYTMLSSVKNGVEKFSDILTLYAQPSVVDFSFGASGLVNKASSTLKFSSIGANFILVNGTYFAKLTNNDTYFRSTSAITLSGDFEYMIRLKIISIPNVLTFIDTLSTGAKNGMLIGINGSSFYTEYATNGSMVYAAKPMSVNISTYLNTLINLSIKRVGSKLSIYVNNVKLSEINLTLTPDLFTNLSNIGASRLNGSLFQLPSEIEWVKIRKI